jgi:uncharacterized protein (TIGR02246 family)
VRRVVLVGLVLLVCVGLAGCGGGGGGTLPTAEVSAVFDRIEQAIATEDADMLVSCYAPVTESVDIDGNVATITREEHRQLWQLMFAIAGFPVYEVTNRQIVFHGSDEAVVTGTINVTIYVLGEYNSATSVNRWTLRKIDGKWLIVKAEQLA